MTDTTPTRDEAVLSVDALAQEIRRVDGSHSLGAGALAEALMPFLLASAPSGVVAETKGPYEARICKGMPEDCCDYGVVSLSEGREVCRVWREQDARAIAASLSPAATPVSEAEPGEGMAEMGEIARIVSEWRHGPMLSPEALRQIAALTKPASSPAGVREASLSRSDVCRLWQYAAIERPSMTVEGFTNLLLNEIDDRAESLSQSTSAGRVGE